ncbi:MAG: hypothetical protein R8G66_17020 [Cytophagales bacterium]|nr:hypothetical protein [Cytophagales bacterium]
MLVNDELYFHTFCKLLEAVVAAGGVEAPVEHLQKNHFHFLSRKINSKSCADCSIQPATIRDYRYIYKREKKFSVRQNRLDLMCDYLGYNGWNDFRSNHFPNAENKQQSNEQVRLLILPDKRFGAIQHFEGQIGELICNRYEELKEELGIDELEIIYRDHLKSSPAGIKGIRDFGKANKADMVIWTEYIHGIKPMMRVPSILVDPYQKVCKREKKAYQDAAELINLHEGTFLEESDIMLFQLLATTAHQKVETKKAVEYLEKILQLDPEHEESINQLGILLDQQEASGQSTNLGGDKTNAEVDADPQEKSGSDAIHHQNQLYPPHQDTSNTDQKRDHFAMPNHTASLDNHLLILEGDNRVLKVKDLEPLIRNTIIHEEETIIFLTSKTDIALLSLNDRTIFTLKTSQQEVPVKEALVRLNQWHQNIPNFPKGSDQLPLCFHPSTPVKPTKIKPVASDLIGIIIRPNTGNKMLRTRQLKAS